MQAVEFYVSRLDRYSKDKVKETEYILKNWTDDGTEVGRLKKKYFEGILQGLYMVRIELLRSWASIDY